MALGSPDVNAVIARNLQVFDKPGVLSIRPGFKVTNNWLTSKHSIVATVLQKVPSPPEGEMLPSEVEGVPVDVRQASPEKREEVQNPKAYSASLRLTPDTGSVPHFPDERTPAGAHPTRSASAHAQLAAIPKPKLDYSGPAGGTLPTVEAQATIHLSASPDSGWPVLEGFLKQTGESLTVGLYDFTSAHIETTLTAAMAGKQLKLVLDHPPQNATADQTDADTVAYLRQALGDDFDQAWALTRLDRQATAWIYPTSYHIKVAVRDRSAFWLSSGNWNNSNQPDIDPGANAADATAARHRDRDWHVVIEHPQLAGIFEDYILNDLSVARSHNGPPESPGLPLPPPTGGASETKAFHEFFPSDSITGTFTFTPLLTPDPGVYVQAIKAMIAGAKQTLYMQFQYIQLPKAGSTTSQGFLELVQTVIDRQNAGVEVKIIMSEYEKAGYLEQLQAIGLNVVNNVKIQNNVHNKGIIVDGKRVLVSSQNWSTDGTLYNRDAGIIIDSEPAALYFQKIFLHDWQYLAETKVLSD
ncbi:MAG TPA: phospholipase D-like domain-containing protein [Solirubrobacteraceae bacterium]|nr:phospholipase D-like domain-containing protein [Solirubrobacteraceae bacterium]